MEYFQGVARPDGMKEIQSWRGGLWDMGTVKAFVGFLAIVAAMYAGFQITPPELTNYSFQDDLKNIAMVGRIESARQPTSELLDAVIKKARNIRLRSRRSR